MSKIIILQDVIDLRTRVNEEIEWMEHLLQKCEARLFILEQERKSIVETLQILEREKEKS